MKLTGTPGELPECQSASAMVLTKLNPTIWPIRKEVLVQPETQQANTIKQLQPPIDSTQSSRPSPDSRALGLQAIVPRNCLPLRGLQQSRLPP